jgi:hypothetical protein
LILTKVEAIDKGRHGRGRVARLAALWRWSGVRGQGTGK